MKIIGYFEKGKQWEHAIPLCKELAKVYEEKVFDFDKLSGILKRQASLFEKVLSTSEENLRLDPEYFRVGFYGKGFPLFLRVRPRKLWKSTRCGKIGSYNFFSLFSDVEQGVYLPRPGLGEDLDFYAEDLRRVSRQPAALQVVWSLSRLKVSSQVLRKT